MSKIVYPSEDRIRKEINEILDKSDIFTEDNLELLEVDVSKMSAEKLETGTVSEYVQVKSKKSVYKLVAVVVALAAVAALVIGLDALVKNINSMGPGNNKNMPVTPLATGSSENKNENKSGKEDVTDPYNELKLLESMSGSVADNSQGKTDSNSSVSNKNTNDNNALDKKESIENQVSEVKSKVVDGQKNIRRENAIRELKKDDEWSNWLVSYLVYEVNASSDNYPIVYSTARKMNRYDYKRTITYNYVIMRNESGEMQEYTDKKVDRSGYVDIDYNVPLLFMETESECIYLKEQTENVKKEIEALINTDEFIDTWLEQKKGGTLLNIKMNVTVKEGSIEDNKEPYVNCVIYGEISNGGYTQTGNSRTAINPETITFVKKDIPILPNVFSSKTQD